MEERNKVLSGYDAIIQSLSHAMEQHVLIHSARQTLVAVSTPQDTCLYDTETERVTFYVSLLEILCLALVSVCVFP